MATTETMDQLADEPPPGLEAMISSLLVLNNQDEALRRMLLTPASYPPPSYPPPSSQPPSPEPTHTPSPKPSPTPSPTPTPTPTPTPGPSPSPTPTPSPSDTTNTTKAPTCDGSSCFTVNATSGSIFDNFLLTAPGWASGAAAFPTLMYEFGVLSGSVYKARQAYSTSNSAVLVGLPSGAMTLYVCIRAANTQAASAASSQSLNAVGPRSCNTIGVQVSAQVTKEQIADQITAIKSAAYRSASITTTSAALDMAQRLAAVVTVTNGTNSTSTDNSTTADTTLTALASGLLTQLVNVSSQVNDTASVLAVIGGVSTLWSMAAAESRASVVSGVSAITKALATQALAVEDAQPVIDLFTKVLDSAADIVLSAEASTNTSSSGTGTGGSNSTADGGNRTSTVSAAASAAARNLLTSVTQAAAALTQGLLNGAPANGTAVYISTARLSAAVQRATAALASAGVTMSVAPPSGTTAAAAGRRRHLLLTSSVVSVSLSPSVGSVCAADTVCASAGLGLTVTVTADSSLLRTALSGSFEPLVANISGYRTGGTVQVISPIVRVAAPGLPAAAVGMNGLVLLDVPINTTALNASATRVLVRLQDFGAAPTDVNAGIPAAASVTTTRSSASIAADLVSGYSNELGDFVVVQYVSGAVPTSGQSGAAGPARLPSLLVSALVGLATLGLALLA